MSCVTSRLLPTVARHARLEKAVTVAVALALAFASGAGSAVAQSKICPQATPSYTGPCGPTFVLPAWGDAGGWTKPQQYETIQLADVDGAPGGAKELVARTPAGVEVQWFDKTLGQWRPQVDAQDRPLIIPEFADPPPLTTAHPNPPRTDWTLPQYYDTQAADIDGDGRAEIVGRGLDGLIEFKFTPGDSPGEGSWTELQDPSHLFNGFYWHDPSRYATIQFGDFDGDGDAEVIGRGSNGIVALKWLGFGSGWGLLPDVNILGDKDNGFDPAYWTSIQVANVAGDRVRQEVIARDAGGVTAWGLRSGHWTNLSHIPGSTPFSDVPQEPDCPFYPWPMSGLRAGVLQDAAVRRHRRQRPSRAPRAHQRRPPRAPLPGQHARRLGATRDAV